MQTLWSRAAQTRSCRCGSCLQQAATTIARRTTTAASRRKLTVGDLFTACYSTILGTAVFADAKVKEDRRKEWDRLIAEARAIPVQMMEGNEKSSVVDLNLEVKEKPRSPMWGSTYWTAPMPVTNGRGRAWLNILDTNLKQSHAETTKTHTNEPTELDTAALEVLMEEWTDDNDPEGLLPPREPRNSTQMLRVQQSIANLAMRLLRKSNADSTVLKISTTTTDSLSVQMEEILYRFQALKREDTRLPSYCLSDPATVEEERQGLHKSLIVLFKKASSGHINIDILCAKICYNLLVTSNPPSIITYNILINCFTKLQQYELGGIVIDSLLYESRYRPNPATARLILDHFALKGDLAGFRKIIRRMRGVDGDMRVRRRSLEHLVHPETAKWALENKVSLRPPFLIQRFPRNATIFNSLIQGSLNLIKDKSAIRYIRAAIREGYRVDSATLVRTAKACLEKVDYIAGRLLLSAILWQWNHFPDALQLSKDVRYAIHQLLALCAVDPNSAFHESLQGFMRHVKLESISDSIDRFASLLSSVETLLNVTSSQQPNKDAKISDQRFDSELSEKCPRVSVRDVDLALRILNEASKRERKRNRRGKRGAAHCRLQTVRILEAKVFERERDVYFLRKELLSISYHCLSPLFRMKYDRQQAAEPNMEPSEMFSLLQQLHRSANHRSQQQKVRKEEKEILISEGEYLDKNSVEEPSPRLRSRLPPLPSPNSPPISLLTYASDPVIDFEKPTGYARLSVAAV
jgi:hypothetical protein